MIIPSIDIKDGVAVQLIGGKELAIEAGDPRPLAEKFGRVGELAVIDLNAALSTGNNQSIIESLLAVAQCRVGGGIRDVRTARYWLNAGAAKIILGTAAHPDLLKQLPSERLIAALDAVHSNAGDGEILDQGWQRPTGLKVLERIKLLREYVGGFLITFVEREGRMTGIDLETIKNYKAAAGGTKLTIAGGVATAEEIAELEKLGIDAQIGMALYTNQVPLAEGFCSPLISDREDGLWPTIVTEASGLALGLVYSNLESVNASLESGEAHYYSRKRGLWKKGETSGNTQKLLSISADCDRDSLLFKVVQNNNLFCHLNQATCFGDLSGVLKLTELLQSRLVSAPKDSYSRRLFDSKELLNSKIVEEALEFSLANSRTELIHEAADVFFFTFTKLVKNGVRFNEVEKELDRRAMKVTRRSGDSKLELSQ